MLYQAGLDALSRGWSVLPVQSEGEWAKRPAYVLVETGHKEERDGKAVPAWKGLQTKPPTADDIAIWFAKPNGKGLAVVTGAVSELVIIDFDGPEGEQLRERLGLPAHVRTGSGGAHTYFQHPGWNVSTLNSKAKAELGARWPGLDIRADGGYAVMPPSRNTKGPYLWEAQAGLPEPLPLTALPEDLRAFLGLLERPAPPNPAPSPLPRSDASQGRRQDEQGRVSGELLMDRALDRVGSDGRNVSGFWLACQLRDNRYSEGEAQAVMEDFAHRVPGTNTKGHREAYTVDDARKSVREAYSRAPRDEWERQERRGPAVDVGNLAPLPEAAPIALEAATGPVILTGDVALFPAVEAALRLPHGDGVTAKRVLSAEELRTLVQNGRPVYALNPSDGIQRALDASGVEWYVLPTLSLPADPSLALNVLSDAMTEAYSQALTGSLNFLESELLNQADARLQRGGNIYPTGLVDFDEVIGGGLYDGLHVLGGVTGGGKTALALAIAESNARAGRPVLYITYEQSRYELWGRLISTRAGVSLRQLRSGGTLEHPVSEKLRDNAQYQSLMVDVAPWLSVIEGDGFEGGSWGVDRIAAQVRRIKGAHGAAPLVILDYLQRMPSGSEKDKRHQIDDIVMGLQVRLGRELSAPLLLISSVGRGKYGELAAAPLEDRLSVFKESGGVEYTAYTATLLYPLGLLQSHALGLEAPPQPGSGRAALKGLWKYLVLDLAKNREGEAPRQWVVQWFPARGTFTLVKPLDPDELVQDTSAGARRPR